MKQILKRLELIKTAIAIEDEEIIDLQVVKINALDVDCEVKQILADIHSNHYGKVAIDIDNYILRLSGLIEYQDKELEGLRLELKALEKIVQELSGEKCVYLSDIEDFNILYHLRLGGIIQKVLKARKDLLEKVTQATKEYSINDEYSKTQEEYDEAKKDYQEFSDEYEQTKLSNIDVYQISEDEQQELKKLWKQGAKLCHPDIVADELKEGALEIMQSLNKAYSNKDLNAVRELVNALEFGAGFTVTSDSIDNKEILKVKIDEFRAKIAILEQDIISIKKDEIYLKINKLTDIDAYLSELKIELEKEYEQLKNSIDNWEQAASYKE